MISLKKKLLYKIDKVEQLNNGIIVWHWRILNNNDLAMKMCVWILINGKFSFLKDLGFHQFVGLLDPFKFQQLCCIERISKKQNCKQSFCVFYIYFI